ncbi:MAG: type 2 isopentenyl-diphosphate Delta-isomerase [Candidatus Dormibacteria bacterium]
MGQTDHRGAGGRKSDHLRINLEADVSSGLLPGFDDWRFVPRALPEIALSDVDLGCQFLGHSLGAPVLISCMTGGTEGALEINRALARTAAAHGFALGLGSGRVLLEDPSAGSGFDVRDDAKGVPLLANLGAVQLTRGVTLEDCRRLVEMQRADCLVLHLNAVQEALQGGGDTDFGGVLAAIGALCAAAPWPVIVKEVGWGVPPDDVRRLFDAGVAAVDIAGAGGTSWSEVERHRAEGQGLGRFDAFWSWGLPTSEALRRAREVAPAEFIIGSGGVRDGMDAAKAIALGADLVGIAGPFLRAAAEGEDVLDAFSRDLVEVLRLVHFATGSGSPSELRCGRRLEPRRS